MPMTIGFQVTIMVQVKKTTDATFALISNGQKFTVLAVENGAGSRNWIWIASTVDGLPQALQNGSFYFGNGIDYGPTGSYIEGGKGNEIYLQININKNSDGSLSLTYGSDYNTAQPVLPLQVQAGGGFTPTKVQGDYLKYCVNVSYTYNTDIYNPYLTTTKQVSASCPLGGWSKNVFTTLDYDEVCTAGTTVSVDFIHGTLKCDNPKDLN